MKKVVKGFASVILASMFVFIGCNQTTSTSKPSTGGSEQTGQSKITVTVKGDAGVDKVDPETLSVAKGSTWSAIESKITVTPKTGFVHAGWKVNDASGTDLTDNYPFEKDTTVFAVSKEKAKEQVTITVHGDERINPMQIKQTSGTAWSDIKAEIARNIKPSAAWEKDWNWGYYAVYEWRLGGENGKKISDDYRFTENTTVYAVSNYKTWKITSNELLGYDSKKPRGKIIIPDGVSSIGKNAFSGCSSLAEIAIPEGVTSIGESAFSDCSSLASITLPASVKSIEDSAFSGCSNLAEITIPEGVKSIEGSAFNGCRNLASITLPKDLTSIGGCAFFGCTNLAEITIPASVTSIGMLAFQNCSSISSITIPKSVTRIGKGAFFGCSSLHSVDFADPKGWAVYKDNNCTDKAADIDEPQLNDKITSATLLRETYYGKYWKKN